LAGITLATVSPMRNTLAFVVLGLAACGGTETSRVPSDLSPEQADALHALEARSHGTWSLRTHETLGTPAHLSGNLRGALTLLQGRSLESASLDATLHFLEENRSLFRMRAPTQEFRLTRARTDEQAMTHVRLQQTVRGVRVLGAELSAHYDKRGALRVVDANYVAGLENIDVNPALATTQAEAIAIDHAVGPGSTAKATNTELVIWNSDAGDAHLAYTTLVRETSAKRFARQVVIVDAKTGAVLNTYNNIQTVEANATNSRNGNVKIEVSQEGGRYVMKDATRGGGVWTYSANYSDAPDSLPGQVVNSTNINSWDNVPSGRGAAVDAHFYAGKVYDYYKTVHNRLGITGANERMTSSVHFGQEYPNAFWTGDQMGYGDGDSGIPFSASVDVVGHEFTHGVVEAESQLVYQNQSGALNEALADIFGAAIEHEVRPDPTKNWQLGEDLGFIIRDMSKPKSYRQPDHMSSLVRTTQDNGGVHINSGIINNAAFLMAMGGTNSTSGAKVERGLGWEKMAKLFYRANAQYLMSGSNFVAMASAANSAANDLAFTNNEKKIVACAFKVVGIVAGACEPFDPEAPATDAGTPATDAGTSSGSAPPKPGTPTEGSPDEGAPAAQAEEGGELQYADEAGGCSTGSTRTSSGALLLALAAILGLRRKQS
jgi:bacillolysin